VWVDDRVVGAIDGGLVLLVGVTHGDTERDVDYLAEKTAHLRIFEDESDKMSRSVLDVGLSILSISQFTLYGDCRKGRRPNFMEAASPHLAEPLYDSFNQALRRRGLTVATGVFGAMMKVELVNDGPVTLLLES
jgi:D-tyrosyl-tRNA(Tyr) deacylase